MKKYLGLLTVVALLIICIAAGTKWMGQRVDQKKIQQDTPNSKVDVSEPTKEPPKYTIVLDAGHGGFDPGKVGVNGAKEKDINLAIVQKLKTLLEQENIRVVLTRETDVALFKESCEKN